MPDLERRTYRSDVRELRHMSSWWRDWAMRAGLKAETADAGELCLNEAVANIILYGDGPEPGNAIEITLERTARSAEMTIVDGSDEFNPLAHRDPTASHSLEAAREGGRGIPLMREYSSHVQYRRQDRRNILTLTFDI